MFHIYVHTTPRLSDGILFHDAIRVLKTISMIIHETQKNEHVNELFKIYL